MRATTMLVGFLAVLAITTLVALESMLVMRALAAIAREASPARIDGTSRLGYDTSVRALARELPPAERRAFEATALRLRERRLDLDGLTARGVLAVGREAERVPRAATPSTARALLSAIERSIAELERRKRITSRSYTRMERLRVLHSELHFEMNRGRTPQPVITMIVQNTTGHTVSRMAFRAQAPFRRRPGPRPRPAEFEVIVDDGFAPGTQRRWSVRPSLPRPWVLYALGPLSSLGVTPYRVEAGHGEVLLDSTYGNEAEARLQHLRSCLDALEPEVEHALAHRDPEASNACTPRATGPREAPAR